MLMPFVMLLALNIYSIYSALHMPKKWVEFPWFSPLFAECIAVTGICYNTGNVLSGVGCNG